MYRRAFHRPKKFHTHEPGGIFDAATRHMGDVPGPGQYDMPSCFATSDVLPFATPKSHAHRVCGDRNNRAHVDGHIFCNMCLQTYHPANLSLHKVACGARQDRSQRSIAKDRASALGKIDPKNSREEEREEEFRREVHDICWGAATATQLRRNNHHAHWMVHPHPALRGADEAHLGSFLHAAAREGFANRSEVVVGSGGRNYGVETGIVDNEGAAPAALRVRSFGVSPPPVDGKIARVQELLDASKDREDRAVSSYKQRCSMVNDLLGRPRRIPKSARDRKTCGDSRAEFNSGPFRPRPSIATDPDCWFPRPVRYLERTKSDPVPVKSRFCVQCGLTVVGNKRMDVHTMTECAARRTDCMYLAYGCREFPRVSDLAKHERVCPYRFRDVIATAEKQRREGKRKKKADAIAGMFVKI